MSNQRNNWTVTVTVESIGIAQTVGTKGHQKQGFVGHTDGQYPNYYDFECFGRNVDLMANLEVGNVIEVVCEPRGRKWTSPKTGKTSIFTSFDVSEIRVVKGNSGEAATPADNFKGIDVSDVEEDMPF